MKKAEFQLKRKEMGSEGNMAAHCGGTRKVVTAGKVTQMRLCFSDSQACLEEA